MIVVFGAAVRPDGSPTPTLARRVGYAAAVAEAMPGADLFCSGGVGRPGQPSEAAVMRRLLEHSVAGRRIHLDGASRDTLETVRAATAFLRAGGYDRCLSCTDGYHQPRVLMLFRMFGVRCRPVWLPRRGPRRLRLKQLVRESAAVPYDLVAGSWARWRRGV